MDKAESIFYSEADNWRVDESNILSVAALSTIKATLENEPVIVEHRLYRRASAPKMLVFDEYDHLLEYLKEEALPGDDFWIWPYSQLCRDDNAAVSGKYPDSKGRTPEGGAY